MSDTCLIPLQGIAVESVDATEFEIDSTIHWEMSIMYQVFAKTLSLRQSEGSPRGAVVKGSGQKRDLLGHHRRQYKFESQDPVRTRTQDLGQGLVRRPSAHYPMQGISREL